MKQILYYIDHTYISLKKVRMEGWAVSKTGRDVLFHSKRNSSIKKTKRSDVEKCYTMLSEDANCGFELEVTGWIKDTITLSDGENEVRFDVNCVRYKLKYLKSVWKRVLNKIKTSGCKATLRAILNKLRQKNVQPQEDIYSEWRLAKIVDTETLEKQRGHVFSYCPLISVIVPTFNTPVNFLKEMIDSILAQSYTHWELCIADGGSRDVQTIETLKEYERKYENISVLFMEENKMISGNTNEALSLVKGEFVALFDHDDVVEPDALYECVSLLNDNQMLDMIYTDEDKVDTTGKKYFEPHFKPDYSKYTLRSYNYITHFTIIRKTILDTIGGFDSACDGAQDFDMFLRISEVTERIAHIPKVLYHWRVHSQSTAASATAKTYVLDAGKLALRKHFEKNNISASVRDGIFPTSYKTQYDILGNPFISIIIPNKDHVKDLRKCLTSILSKTNYANYEIVIVENNSVEKETFAYYEMVSKAHKNIKIVKWEGTFNYSAINNFGVKKALGDFILLLNNDVEVINKQWLTEMLMLAQQDDVGAVGAKLYYEDNTVQHAGVIIGIGSVAGHSHKYYSRYSNGYVGRLSVVQNVSAVTAACLLIKKSKFLEVDGLDESFEVAFNDVDFCLKLVKQGYQNIYTPFAQLYHYESKSRGLEDTDEKVKRFNGEIKRFEEKWGLWREDPYYNKNLSIIKEDFSLRV